MQEAGIYAVKLNIKYHTINQYYRVKFCPFIFQNTDLSVRECRIYLKHCPVFNTVIFLAEDIDTIRFLPQMKTIVFENIFKISDFVTTFLMDSFFFTISG